MRSLCVSLPVANLRVAVAFFSQLGFEFKPEPAHTAGACMIIDDNVTVRLVERQSFLDSINGDGSGVGAAGEVLASILVASEDEVDKILARALSAGARPWPIEPELDTYSGSFQDMDGYIWQISYRELEPVQVKVGKPALPVDDTLSETAPVPAGSV